MMYKIIFHYPGLEADEVYGGGSYVVNGERYAVLNSVRPKLYKSEKVAINAAKKLMNPYKYVNTSRAESCSIEEASDDEISHYLARGKSAAGVQTVPSLPSLLDERRKDCPMRHENGNCTVAGGFCTSVSNPICEALHNAYDCGFRAGMLHIKEKQEE